MKAPAKINLCLYVMGKRPDNYHEIFSLMQTIGIYDELEIEPGERFNLEVAGAKIDGENLIARAHRALEEHLQRNIPVKVRLKKNIPIGAGLGGGSSDAAAFLIGVNKLFNLNLPAGKLAQISARVGSDVPFFIYGGGAVVRGRGELVEPVALPRDYAVVVVVPPIAVSTAWAYSNLRKFLTPPEALTQLRYAGGSIFDFIGEGTNSFESLVMRAFPEIERAGNLLRETGAKIVRLSGSGAAVFGIFENLTKAKKATEQIRGTVSEQNGWRVVAAEPVDGILVE